MNEIEKIRATIEEALKKASKSRAKFCKENNIPPSNLGYD